jgi:transposase
MACYAAFARFERRGSPTRFSSSRTTVTIVTEVGTFQRFERATKLMGHTGLVSSENSSGDRTSKGGITHTGNAHLRHVLGEAACD